MALIIILAIGGILVFVLLLMGIIITIRSNTTAAEERMEQLVIAGRVERGKKYEKPKQTPLTDWINTRVEKSSFGDRIARSLARADIKMKPGEYVALIIISAFGTGLVAWFTGGRSILIGLIGAILGLFFPNMYINSQQKGRLTKFNNQLPDMLNLMVNGLRAGYSTMQAMEAVSKELPAPICDEFRRVVQEIQLGVPMEKAMDNLLKRIPSDDLDFVITAMNVQREVGGNLAEVMDTISFTIRERIRIKGEIRGINNPGDVFWTLSITFTHFCTRSPIFFKQRLHDGVF